jgi:kynureninase
MAVRCHLTSISHLLSDALREPCGSLVQAYFRESPRSRAQRGSHLDCSLTHPTKPQNSRRFAEEGMQTIQPEPLAGLAVAP